jgi:integrase/recombinase XerD
LHPRLVDLLAAALAGRPQTGPLIESDVTPGAHISPDRARRLLGRALRDAGVEATGHQLRHTFATEILAAGRGQNLRAVSRMLGHSSIATTERYTSGYDADAIEAVRWLPDPEPNPRPTDQRFPAEKGV